LKILFVCSGNRNKGEPSILVANQGKSLEKNNTTILYYTINSSGFFGYLKAIFGLRKKIKKSQPNVIHSHYSLSAFTTTITLIIFRIKIPHVVSLMGSDSKLGGWKRKFTKRFANKNWDRTIVKAKSMAEDLDLKTFEVVPNGVDLSVFQNSRVADGSLVLFPADPGRPSKNFQLANEAFTLAKKKNDSIQMKIVFGVEHDQMIHQIQNASCVLVTSLWEGSPNIVKESMAANTPVLCTNVGDAEWLLRDVNGSFVTNFEVNSIAEKILEAVSYSQIHGETNGRTTLRELSLDSDSVANRLIGLYESTWKEV